MPPAWELRLPSVQRRLANIKVCGAADLIAVCLTTTVDMVRHKYGKSSVERLNAATNGIIERMLRLAYLNLSIGQSPIVTCLIRN